MIRRNGGRFWVAGYIGEFTENLAKHTVMISAFLYACYISVRFYKMNMDKTTYLILRNYTN